MKENIKKMIRPVIFGIYRVFAKSLPVNKKIVIFGSNVGKNYSGSPRSVYEEMIRQGLDAEYKCIWVFDHPEKVQLPGRGQAIKSYRLRHYYYMCVAGAWVFDTRQRTQFVKKNKVTYIQTWHGTPLKKLGVDMDTVSMAGETNIEKYRENFLKNSSRWDYLVSQNPFSTAVFRRAFGFQKQMLEIGYPRNDVLFTKNNPEDIRELKVKFGIPEGKRVILYAPTWRDDQFYGKGQYKFISGLNFDMLRDALGEDTVLIVKYHYLVADKMDWSAYNGFIYQFDNSYDIAELYLASDMLITDYSSVMFDYSLLKRPILFYAYDLEAYRDSLRGFYFDLLEEAPGPISETTEELIGHITYYDQEEYADKYAAFCEKYNPWDDGKASEKVVEVIRAMKR
ncbi:CDP-glycerol glycerophosphotransferase family protein [Anaerolentibacter hominis]|uniref:CDP-glycerol glycerophosphotransferase family protein n=1 Tax=Anaerolentibacter hominis TaxID=3079009 RepID=UPI0031B85E18